MDAVSWVRQFFRQQLRDVEAELHRFHPGVNGSTRQLISHLVDQTVRRAVLDASTHGAEARTEEVSWRDCLMAAAFVELRAVKLVARNKA